MVRLSRSKATATSNESLSLMGLIRYWLSFAVITSWYGAIMTVAGLLKVKQRKGGIFDRSARGWGASLLRWNGIRVEVEGRERLRGDRPCIYVANHVSFVDIWAMVKEMPDTVRFVSKKELFRVPAMGQAMKAAGHISIDRKNHAAAFAMYDEAAVMVREGTSAVVFPEGTRSWEGTLMPFKKGPFVLAIKAQVPVVPVHIHGTFDIMRRGSRYPRKGVIRLVPGAEIPTEGLTFDDRDALSRRTREALQALAAG